MPQPSDGAAGLMRAGPGRQADGHDRQLTPGRLPAAPRDSELRVDLCVIGGGSGGLSVAAAAAQLGVSVALVEKHKMGGDCLNYGCVPSKALIAAARRAQLMRSSRAVRHRASAAHRSTTARSTTTFTASSPPSPPTTRWSASPASASNVIQAAAHFVSRDTVLAGDHRIKARRFVIATGSSPAIPPIPGLDRVPYFTNETIFDNREKLDHLIVIGGGPIGLELGAGLPAARQPRHRLEAQQRAGQGRSRTDRGGAQAPAGRGPGHPRRRDWSSASRAERG